MAPTIPYLSHIYYSRSRGCIVVDKGGCSRWWGRWDAGVGPTDTLARGESSESARGALGPPSLASSSTHRLASRSSAGQRRGEAVKRLSPLLWSLRTISEGADSRILSRILYNA